VSDPARHVPEGAPTLELSAIVPTFNEERRIAACLESLSFCDEIVLVDSFSTDRTLEVARRYTERVYQRAWSGSNDQKDFARRQARGEWVLSIDADEVVTPALAREIREHIRAGDAAGYRIPIRTYFRERWVKAGGLWPGRHLRLFRRDLGYWDPSIEPHERVVLFGRVAALRAHVDHHSYDDLRDFLDKAARHAEIWAASQHRAGARAAARDLALRPLFRFVRDYALRGGFLQGAFGLFFCALQAHYTYLKYLDLWERGRERWS
jgi:glycosyltransferase involved in cell wall biosynthesis